LKTSSRRGRPPKSSKEELVTEDLRAQEAKPLFDHVDHVPQTMSDFKDRIAQAQLAGEVGIEVAKQVFDYFMKGSKGKYFTYGAPGVKVFLAGEMETILQHEATAQV